MRTLHLLNPNFFLSSRSGGGSKCSRSRLSRRSLAVAAAAATESGVFASPEIAKSFDFTSEERIYNCSADKEMTCYILASWLSGVESSGESNMETEVPYLERFLICSQLSSSVEFIKVVVLLQLKKSSSKTCVLTMIIRLGGSDSIPVYTSSYSPSGIMVVFKCERDIRCSAATCFRWKDDKSRMKAALIAVPLVEGVLLLFAFHVAYSMLRRKINKGQNISGIIGDDIERAAAEFLDPKTISKNLCRYAGVVTVEGITDVLEVPASFFVEGIAVVHYSIFV
ncbi:hypothetical protein Scep_002654 [Stephania cephalantha]|uniref:Uncharacterized protein n=1 Tax=Stephania cephalantha TaxID=152367 RepID=A0AAP0LBM1_9MAGN